MGVLWGHLNSDATPPSEANPELPGEIDPALAKGMAKAPEERYATGGELVRQARSALRLSGEQAAVVGPRSRRRSRWIVGAMVLALIVVAAVAAAVLATRDGSSGAAVEPITPNSLVRVDPETEEIVGVVPVGRRPRAVAVGEQATVSANQDDRTVSIVDPDTNEVVNTLAIDGTPAAVAIADTVAWVVSTSGGEGVLSQLDLEKSRVRRTSDLGFSHPVGVAVGDQALWITARDISGNAVLQIDPATGDVIATIPTGISQPSDVVAAHGAIWFSLAEETPGSRRQGAVWRVDPDSGDVVATVQVPTRDDNARVALAVGPEEVWATELQGAKEIWRIDAQTNSLTETIYLVEAFSIRDLEFASGSLWSVTQLTSSSPASPAPAELWRVDPRTEETTSRLELIADFDSGGDLAAGPTGLWVAISGVVS